MKKTLPFLVIICLVTSCTTLKKTSGSHSILELKYLDEFDIPHNSIFRNTTVGGLSGIDFDAINNVYYLICDDRSSINPARFYTATINVSGNKIDTVEFKAVNTLMQRDGSAFPNSRKDPYHTPDPEAIRYNPLTGHLVWSSEGERIVRKDSVILENPSIYEMDITGKIVDSFPIPLNLQMESIEKGPRQNGVFEGMSFSDQYHSLLVSVEEPLYEDGPRAGGFDSTGIIRILRYDVSSKKPVAQFAYRVDPVVHPSIPASGFKINGVPDILAVNDSLFLVMERSFSTGRPGCSIRIFIVNLKTAEDISGVGSLLEQPLKVIPKKLILNLDDIGIYIDNVEGMCWGPRLPNGNRSLVMVADNNFAVDEVTQFLLFELRGE